MVLMLKKRIDRGVAFLDKKFGRDQWLKKMNESRLRLDNGNMCVTGQLYEDHWHGFLESMEKKVLGKELEDFDDVLEDEDWNTAQDRAQHRLYKYAANLGFYLTDDDEENANIKYDILTRLWFNRISELKIISGIPLTTPPPIGDDE